ncbi:hypothetical protein GC089_06815 [Cellulomonas sp. JZ18]|uniref:DUF6414 family protein n=1 Tax=Cellulomonas sp. JZ18 TaxID=2654191 RepID=UPI0012D3CFBE|nr:hypothetical protein [Cellulomonas sp. JZ18]QGQ18997.1 hypothetical protein GC089_06815 [Cellulomonas sp. JZ18]
MSQAMTIPESVMLAAGRGSEAEISSSLSADALVGSGEVAARYQTMSSSSQEVSRRALIQSSFKEFRELPLEFKLSEFDKRTAGGFSMLSEFGVKADGLRRGELVEIEVILEVDPVYKLAAMVSEYSEMANAYPQMFEGGVLGFLRGSQPIIKVLQRFLAGLIPIRATAASIVVIEHEGQEYVAESGSAGPDVRERPLRIVGVTEQQNYWKDVRRVLFSDSRVRVLGRIARDGLHDSWTPVKLADLFSDVSPDLVDNINAIEAPSATSTTSGGFDGSGPMVEALRMYKDHLVANVPGALWPSGSEFVLSLLGAGVETAAQQRQAFDEVRSITLASAGSASISPEDDLAARTMARAAAGVSLFPSASTGPSATTTSAEGNGTRGDHGRFLDIEIVAIYW